MDLRERRRFHAKITFVLGVGLLLLAFTSLWIFNLQALQRGDLTEWVKKRFARVYPVKIPLYRGGIRDQSGKDLALSVPSLSVYVHPNPDMIRNKEEFLKGLSRITGVPLRKLEERIKKRKLRLVSGVDSDLKPLIRKLITDTGNARFVGIQEEFKRVYPHGKLASNLLGFVGVDGIGLEGLEYMLNDYLGGGFSKALIYFNGGLGKIYLHPLKGMLGGEKDVILTLDFSVQSILEDIKREIVKRWKPKKVSLIVMDLETGFILGMANYPDYDPNRFYLYPPSKRRNFAVTDVFEPGSIMKPFFVGMALEKGYVTPKTVVDTGKGRVKVYGRYVRDIRRLGRITLKEVLVHSSNVGTIKVAMNLTKEDVLDLLRRFHLDRRLGVFPGEANPQIPDFNYPANILYASIGQGLALSALNVAVAFGGLATGEIIKPQIVKEIISPEGEVVFKAKKEVLVSRTFSEKTLKWLRGTLTDVVEKGTGRRARSKFFTIAGKTGTSQKFDKKLGRYSREKVVTYFAGFFPATDPKFVAVIVVDEPQGRNLYGGVVSAPYFKVLAERVALYYGLKPDKLK